MIAERLKYLRKQKRLTQSELAEKLNITRGTYAHYEIGKRNPDYETLNRLADFFDVDTDYLLGRTDKKKSTKDESEFESFINDPELERWHKELPKSSEEDLRKLRKMWEIIKSEEKE